VTCEELFCITQSVIAQTPELPYCNNHSADTEHGVDATTCFVHFSLPSTFLSSLAVKRKVVQLRNINSDGEVEAQILSFQTSALEGG
jgi:hypothetical protein